MNINAMISFSLALVLAPFAMPPVSALGELEFEAGHWGVVDGIVSADAYDPVDVVCGSDGIRIFATWSNIDSRPIDTARRAEFHLEVFRNGWFAGSSTTSNAWTSTPHSASSGLLDTPSVTIPVLHGPEILEITLTGSAYGLSALAQPCQ